MKIALRIFYRRIYVTGIQSIPPNHPVILVANHHSSLMDAALLGVLLKRPIHFFTRGDVFSNRFAGRLLKGLHMIPVFNHEGGKETIAHNDESFEKAEAILQQGGMIVFFAEGNSHIDRTLKPLRKGAFRLGFKALEASAYNLNIFMIPVGINYAHHKESNSDVMIHFATPVLLNDYMQAYRLNPSVTLLQLAKESYQALLPFVLHLNNESHAPIAEKCLLIKRNEYTFHTPKWIQATSRRLELEKKVCDTINRLHEPQLTEVSISGLTYFEKLKQYKIKDRALALSFQKKSRTSSLLFIAGFPLFVIGYFLNAWPILFARYIADKKVTRPDFYTWIYVTTSAFLYLVWLILLFGAYLFAGWSKAVALLTITVVTGIFASSYINAWNNYSAVQKVIRLRHKNAPAYESLVEKRKLFSTVIDSML